MSALAGSTDHRHRADEYSNIEKIAGSTDRVAEQLHSQTNENDPENKHERRWKKAVEAVAASQVATNTGNIPGLDRAIHRPAKLKTERGVAGPQYA
jgi:hypothetical protein